MYGAHKFSAQKPLQMHHLLFVPSLATPTLVGYARLALLSMVFGGMVGWPGPLSAATAGIDCEQARKLLDAGRRTQKRFTGRIIEPVIGGRCIADGDGAFTNASSFSSCETAPKHAMDGDPTTRWCEGRPGLGRREVLLVPMAGDDYNETLSVLTSPDGVAATRPHHLRLHVFSARRSGDDREPCHTEWTGLAPLFKHDIELEDSGEYQEIDVPALPGGLQGVVVGFEILDTYADAGHTCISEIGPGLPFNTWLIAQLDLLYPDHGMTPAALHRFVEGTRIVASHAGFETQGQVWRFVLISWSIGVEFVRLPWAKAIFDDPDLSPEEKAAAMVEAVARHEDSLQEKIR